jgi:pyruvate kinase
VGVLGDLSGPKIRLGQLPENGIMCQEGSMFQFVKDDAAANETHLTCTYDKLIDDVDPGDRILLADGTVSMLVVHKADDGNSVSCLVAEPGLIRSRQGVNLPGVRLSTPSVTEKDEADLKWALQNDLDFVGLSFVRSAKDIEQLRSLIDSAAPTVTPLIVAKIEKTEAVDDLDAILEATDAVMVARGDLGVEAEISRVPILQKDIIRRCNERRIPVITATQMLDSMQANELPTRAEVSDVANAVIDGTDAVMLSGETAIGEHPVTCVTMMEKISIEAEPLVAHKVTGNQSVQEIRLARPVTEAVAIGAVVVARELNASLIVVATETGRTALAMSRQRCNVPILAVTHREDTARRMCLYWGVHSRHSKLVRQSADALLEHVVQWGLEHQVLRPGNRVIVVGHTSWLGEGQDLMMVHEVT